MPGDARSTLLITLFTGIGLETGSRETAHTAIDLSHRRQRLDRCRESRQMGAILRFGVRTAARAQADYCSISSRSLRSELRGFGARTLQIAVVKRLAPVSAHGREARRRQAARAEEIDVCPHMFVAGRWCATALDAQDLAGREEGGMIGVAFTGPIRLRGQPSFSAAAIARAVASSNGVGRGPQVLT